MKALALIITSLGMLLSFHASAQDGFVDVDDTQKAKQEMCKENLCQKNLRVHLKLKDGKEYDRTFDVFPPVVQSIGLIFVAGQEINIEADVSGDTLVNYKVVDKITQPKKTITVSFKQEKDIGMMLVVKNPFEKTLKFNMAIMPMDKDGLFKTSSCPIIAGGSIYEMWPEPIFQILLTNPKFLDAKDENMACVY